MTTEDLMFGLPAPSDFELAAADARKPVRRYTFNEFCKWKGIQEERFLFHAFVRQTWAGDLILIEWLIQWIDFILWGRAAIIAAEDARDQYETQQDALS